MESPTLSEENPRSPPKSSMAPRKAEIILQRELETQEDWEDFLSKEGLLVIDVYQEWAGPCTSLVNNFKKLRNELSDDFLRYAVAKADRIESLVLYRGKCKPCFLFFAGGVLVNVIRGAQYPLIRSTIIDELAQEHKVLDGEARRVKIIDKELPFVKEPSESEEEESEVEELPDEVTVAIIKPDAVQDGQVETIIKMMEAEGVEIVANVKKLLTEETAREFYQHLSEEPFYEDYIQFMTSGPCHVLVLKKKNNEKGIVYEWKEKLGPVTVEEAKESAPNSLRAKFGSRGFMNALHGSDSQSSAMRELGFFFPQLSSKLSHRKSKTIERTLAIIRPDAYILYKDEIIAKIMEAGFKIAFQKEIALCRSDIEEFYSHVVEEDYFEDLVEEMTSGPILALGLAREDAVAKWKEILGPPDKHDAFETAPNSLRAQFVVPETDVNLIHGSDTVADAEKEISFFFPREETVAVIKPEAFGTKGEIMTKIEEAGFKITASKELVLTEDIINKMYRKEQPYYEDLKRYLMTGPSMFMVLTREDAVYGFRQLLGPVDPLEAKQIDPNLFRAQFGTDIMKNALHASSSSLKVQLLKNIVFGPDTSWDQGIPPSGEMSPNILTSSGSPLSLEYAMTREAAEDETKPLQPVVNIIPESSIEDVLGVDSSVEIVGAKLSSVKEQQAIERRESEGIEEKDATAEEITQEAQDEVSKPAEAAEETEKPPEAAEETEKPPEAAEATEKPPEAAEATEKPPEAAEETEKPPEAAEETEKPPEAAEETEKPPEAAEETEKPPEAAEATEKPPEAAEETEKPPEAAEETEKPPEAAEATEKPPEASEATEKPPEAAEATEKPPEAAEETEKPPEAAEETEKPPEAAELPATVEEESK